MVVVLMPKLGLTMEHGTVARWHFKDGDSVKAGDALYQVETDKLTNEVRAESAGILRIKCPEGSVVPATDIVGAILAPGESAPWDLAASAPAASAAPAQAGAPSATGVSGASGASGGRPRATPKARKLAAAREIDLAGLTGTGPGGLIAVKDLDAAPAAPKVRTSPLAAKLAAEKGVDLASIRKDGRIMKADVLAAATPAPATGPLVAPSQPVPLSAMRRAVARNMSLSWSVAPMVTYNMRADVTALAGLKNSLNAGGRKISYTDLLVKIAACALTERPRVNASLDGDCMIMHEAVNVGVAVALDNGLIVPVIRNAAQKGIGAIAEESARLAEKARSGELSPDEYTGGTFTLSNLGMFGMESFTPIVNQPESAILGVNAIVKTAVEVDGHIVMRPLMNLSLTADHRLVDGAEAARFLALVREIVENPWKMLL